MSGRDVWTIQCQDPKDGSGNLIINLPNDLLKLMVLAVGDELEVAVVGRSIILKPTSDLATRQAKSTGLARQDASGIYRHRLRSLLNIPTDATDQQIHEMVETGLPLSSVDTMRALEIVSFDVHVHQSIDARLSTGASDYLFRVAHIISLAEIFFGDVEKAKRWLSKPKSRFSGRAPIEMLSTTLGTNQVEELLTRATEGMVL